MRKNKSNSADWFIDNDSEYRKIYHKVSKRALTAKTRFQNVELIDTDHLGRMVVLDDRIQSAETDEFIYHEALVHPAMVSHPRPEYILILGGGEGGTLREVLKHPSVLSAVMVDIDKEFVHFCQRYLKQWHRGSFDNPVVELTFDNALGYLRGTKQKFDVIIGDISDPAETGPGGDLYTKEFYTLVRNVLRKDGIFVTHATEIYYTSKRATSIKIYSTLRKIFPCVIFYYEYIPSFSTMWSFIICSGKYNPAQLTSRILGKRIYERKLGTLSYYDTETHRKLFALPKCVRKALLHG